MSKRKGKPLVAGIYVASRNGKTYVGQARDVWDRIETQHLKHAFRPNCQRYDKYLYRAMRKHGKEAFAWKIVCNAGVGVSDELLNRLEIAYIAAYESFGPKGYNLTSGGDGISGHKHDAASRAKIGKASVGRKMSVASKLAMSKRHQGVPKSVEQRQKQSVSMKRRFQESGGTQRQVRQKISAGVSAWVAKRRAAGLPVGSHPHMVRGRRGDGQWRFFNGLKAASRETGVSRYRIRRQCNVANHAARMGV